ncbi:MAG: zinc ribbon domain-containing protein [Actinobacteria bacterium]|nr:zinc ribbon domain-containing protein [Actinomycetota bacterium]
MEPLICPNCGRENSPDSNFCSNCRSSLTAPVDVEDVPQPYPQAQPQKKGIAALSGRAKIGISVAVLLALALTGFIGYKAIKTATYPDLVLDAPPDGYQQVTGQQFDDIAEQFEIAEEDTSLDAFYFAGDGSDQIFLAHAVSGEITLVSFGSNDEPPETEDLAEMERYINGNRSLLERELEKEYGRLSLDAETLLMEAVQLEREGLCGIRINASIYYGETTMLQDRLLFFRDQVTYIAAVQNLSDESNDEGVQYLLENLYFE